MPSFYRPPWRIDIVCRPGIGLPVPMHRLAATTARALDAAHAPAPASLALVLSDDRELAVLNAEHMGHAGPTDVLSFPMLQPSAFPPHPGGDPAARARPDLEPRYAAAAARRVHLGDVVISVERGIEQAHEGRGGQTGDVRWTAADELRLLVIHGVLHVCGWDHAATAEEAAMRSLERDLLAGEG